MAAPNPVTPFGEIVAIELLRPPLAGPEHGGPRKTTPAPRSARDLILPTRRQLRVLRRKTGHPKFTPLDRALLVAASRSLHRSIFGWGTIYALHSRACIERGRVWQAEHYVGAVCDHALSLACLR